MPPKKFWKMEVGWGVNVLIAPPFVDKPVEKALRTVKFATETMGATRILMAPCIPGKAAKFAYEAWIKGEWNPVNATSAAEILRITRINYPGVEISYNSMRTYSFSGKYGQYDRGGKPWSIKEKDEARTEVQKTAEKIGLKVS